MHELKFWGELYYLVVKNDRSQEELFHILYSCICGKPSSLQKKMPRMHELKSCIKLNYSWLTSDHSQ